MGMTLENCLKVTGVVVQVLALAISTFTFVHVTDREKHEIEYGQANQISTWLINDADKDNVVINNTSNNPIYEVTLSPGSLNKDVPYQRGLDVTVDLPPIPPGRWSAKMPLQSVTGMSSEPWVAIAFKDVRGKSWLRNVSGSLVPLNQSPREFLQAYIPPAYNPIHRYKD